MAKCCVRGCTNKLEAGSNIRMFRFPALLEKPKSLVELSKQRRSAWLIALNRTNLPEEILKSIGICSEHFVTGSPARLKDNSEVDWIPTVKMGQQRNRVEKKVTSLPQTTKLKRIGSVEKLSELEKLKNELKCKDALIKNYKDESMQLKHQQTKIVNNYEERLKEKDMKIKMSIRDRELQNKEKEPQRSENNKKGRGVTMRSGRILQKNTLNRKLIKPCVVRIRRFIKIKQEPEEEEFVINKSAPKKNPSKQDTLKETTPSNRTSKVVSKEAKEQTNRQPRELKRRESSLRDRSIKETPSRDNTPLHAKSKASSNKPLSNSPKSITKTVEDPISKSVEQIQLKSTLKKIEDLLPKPTIKKVEGPSPTSLRNVDRSDSPKLRIKKEVPPTPKPTLKKVAVPLPPKHPIRKIEELLPTKQSLKKIGDPQTPKARSSETPDNFLAMASTRTRRAPKPNPKYANDDIITPKLKNKRDKEILVLNEAGLDTDSGEDFYYGMGASSETETNDDLGDAFEANDSSDFSDNEDLLLKRKRSPKSVPIASRSNASLMKRSRPNQRVPQVRTPIPSPFAAKSVEPKKVVQTPQRPMLNQQQMLVNRKRKLEEITPSEPPESIIARNKRLNIALYDANDARPFSPNKSSAFKQTIATSNTKTQSTQATSLLGPKRPMPGPLSSKIAYPSAPKEIPKVKNVSPLHQAKSPTIIDSSPEIADSGSTQDDFETMPTFTIVNINDIIKKKGDCLVPKRAEEEVSRTASPNSINRNNRRKTGHTTILSEKIDTVVKVTKPLAKPAIPSPKTPVSQSIITTQTKPQQLTKLPPPERKETRKPPEEKPSPPIIKPSPPVDKPAPLIDKPAPRILNSVVGKRTYPVQPILSKPDNDLEPESTDNAGEISVVAKENVGSNKVVPPKPAQPRKLPPEKVYVQRQGNKLIKKITCFETWYVINIPEKQDPIVKNCLEIPLITLSNAVKTIRLPSSSWSSKVTLYKLSNQMLNKSNLTPYTGEISDQSIREEEREKYQPSCVMFRRMTQQKSKTRMPYDRAVIFKMKTFFTNIDGKNVRLVGAPSKISSFEDIEVLLELVDELDLLHEFVETASTV